MLEKICLRYFLLYFSLLMKLCFAFSQSTKYQYQRCSATQTSQLIPASILFLMCCTSENDQLFHHSEIEDYCFFVQKQPLTILLISILYRLNHCLMSLNDGRIILASFENIAHLLHQHGRKVLTSMNRIICTNRFLSSLESKQSQINELKSNKNITFISHYEPALHHMRNATKANNKKTGLDSVNIILGQPPKLMQKQLASEKIITLEQMCALYPQKVPLSYRTKENSLMRNKLQKRLSTSLNIQPPISSILYFHPIVMWDQAIQVVLDHQPTLNIIPFGREQTDSASSPYYHLTMMDFIKAVDKCHQLVHNKQLSQIVNFNEENRQVQHFLNHFNLLKQNKQIIVDEDLMDNKQHSWAKVNVQKIRKSLLE